MVNATSRSSFLGGAIDFINDSIENASELPAVLRRYSDQINDELIDTATRNEVEQNLRSNKIQSYTSGAASWLSQPGNLIIAFVGVVGALIFLKR